MGDRMLTSRPLSLHERYSHVRSLLGIPHPITFLITLPLPGHSDTDAFPTYQAPSIDIDSLRQRAEYLQSIWPHLYARISDAHTHCPRWVQGPRAWNGDEVVQRRAVPEGVEESGGMMYWESKDFRASRGSEAGLWGPAWRLTLYESAKRHEGECDIAYIAFSVNHVLADGTGALRLFSALLSSEQYPHEDTPPALESTINIKPGLMVILPQIWTKLIRPKLPRWFQPVEDVDGCLTWPGPLPTPSDGEDAEREEMGRKRDCTFTTAPLEIQQGSTTYPERILLLSIPPHTTTALKSACKARDITLHPVLKTAWTWAMFTTIDSSPSLCPLRTDGGTREYVLVGDTPRSERVPELGHGWATGNYVSGLAYQYKHPETQPSFWAAAASVAQHLGLSQTITEARQKFGSLAYIPNAPNVADTPTGWEVFWDEQRSGKEPYGSAVSVSNLGYTSLLSQFVRVGASGNTATSGSESVEVASMGTASKVGTASGESKGEAQLHWMQPAVPWGDALAVNVIGHAQGLGMTVSILDGAAVTEAQVKKMCDCFVRILERLGTGEEEYAALIA